MKRGFWGDVANGPWAATGVSCVRGALSKLRVLPSPLAWSLQRASRAGVMRWLGVGAALPRPQ